MDELFLSFRMLRRDLRAGGTPINLNGPDGGALAVTLWTVDEQHGRLNFATQTGAPQVDRLIDADEAVAVAYLESVKLQFDLSGFTMVRGHGSAALQCALPREIYRFQRRSAYRVRPRDHHVPTATLRHPALRDMVDQTPQITIPERYTTCGAPSVLGAVELLVNARMAAAQKARP